MRGTTWLVLLLVTTCAALQAAPVVGALTDARMRPVAGARVYSILQGGGQGQACKPKTEASVVTDSEGRYALGELPTLTSDQWRYTVAYLPGKYIGWTLQGPGMAEMERYLGKPRPLVALPAVSRTGLVVDRNGRAMAGVPVKYLGLRVRQGYPLYLPSEILAILGIPTSLTSRSDGRYTITDTAADTDVLVAPRKKGFAARNAAVNPDDLRIVLVPSGRIDGQVRDATGKPLSDAAVMACLQDNCPSSAATDKRGRFVLEDLPPGIWSVSAHRPGLTFAVVGKVKVQERKTTHVPVMSALAIARVSGHVVYADTGKPAQGVSVSVTPAGLGGWTVDSDTHAVTDAEGVFQASTPVGRGFLTVAELPAGYAIDQPYRPITVPKTGLSGVNVRLVKAGVGGGRVVDTAGQPVAGASVSVYMESGSAVETAADGKFLITLPTRDPEKNDLDTVRLNVRQDERNLGATETASRSDLVENKTRIVVGPIVSVSVHVTLPTGKPAVGAKLSLATVFAGGSTYSDISGTRTDASGDAVIDDLLPGPSYGIAASLPGFYDAGKRPRIVPGTSVPRVVNIEMQLATRVQKGRVIDEQGKPVAGAWIQAEGPDMQTIASAKSDATGHFMVRGLPDASIRLAGSKGDRYGSISVSKSSGAVVLQIARMEL